MRDHQGNPGSLLLTDRLFLARQFNTAKLHEIDPETYLADVLERIVSGRTKVNALRELLPWNWKAARSAPIAAA